MTPCPIIYFHNPPPLFESEDDEVDDDAHDYRDKSVDLVSRMNVTEYTPPNTDQTLPVPTAVKAIMVEDIRGQQNPRALTFLAELDEELRNKNKSLIRIIYLLSVRVPSSSHLAPSGAITPHSRPNVLRSSWSHFAWCI